MLRGRLFVSALLFLSLTATTTFQVIAQSCGEHVVASGETLFRIAQNFGTTVEMLVATNNIADPSQIFAGQVLIIPCAENQPAGDSVPTGLAITPANAAQVGQVLVQDLPGRPIELGVSPSDMPQGLAAILSDTGSLNLYALDTPEFPLMSIGGEDGHFVYNMSADRLGSGLAVAEFFESTGGSVVIVSGFPTTSDPTIEINIPPEQGISLTDVMLDGDLLLTTVGDVTGGPDPDTVPGLRMWPLLHGFAGELFIPTQAPVTGIAVGQNESARLIATASLDGVVRVWDISSFGSPVEPGEAALVNEIRPTEGGSLTGTSSSMAFSPDGRYLALGSSTGEIWLWDVANRTLNYFAVLNGPVNAVAFSPDSSVLAMSGGFLPEVEGGVPQEQENFIHLFDVEIFASGTGGAFLGTLTGHNQAVTGLAFNPDGTKLISIAADNTWRIWSVSAQGANIASAAAQPTIIFSALPQTVQFGGTVTLNWSVQNVGGIVITRQNHEGRVDIPITQDTRLQGSFTYTLSDEDLRNAADVTFYLSALDSSGNPINAPGFPQAWMVTLTAAASGSGCSHTFFFADTGDCVVAPMAENAGVAQNFEGGYMLWNGATGTIIVLHSDNTVQSFPDTWNGQQIVTEVPPPVDRFVPERGFGWVWVNESGMRDRLGWALGAEQSYSLRWQSGHVDSPDPRPAGIEYYSWPTGNIVRLTYHDGAVLWDWAA